ncbi:MAG: glycosyltransferase family 9 protein [Terriglobales bacterium]
MNVARGPLPDNWLIVKLAAAGDVLLTTALARALRLARPRATIGWITSNYAAPLLEGNSDLDLVVAIASPGGSALTRARAAWDWMHALQQGRRHGPATVLLAHRSRWLIRSARTSGHARVFAWDDPVPFRRDRHRLALLADLLAAAGVSGPSSPWQPRLELRPHERNQGQVGWAGAGAAPRWVLTPGGASNPWSAMPNRCWPPERFLELARRALAAGVALAFLGGPADAPLTAWIRSRLPPGSSRDFTGRLSLRQSAAVITAADLIVGNDSLPLVMAHACGRPALGLYGPTAGVRIHAPGQPYLQGWAGCGPCYDERAGLRGQAYLCPRARCLEELSVDEVWRSVLAYADPKEHARAV